MTCRCYTKRDAVKSRMRSKCGFVLFIVYKSVLFYNILLTITNKKCIMITEMIILERRIVFTFTNLPYETEGTKMKRMKFIACFLCLTLVFSLCSVYAEAFTQSNGAENNTENEITESDLVTATTTTTTTEIENNAQYYINNLDNRKFLHYDVGSNGRILNFSTGTTTNLDARCVWTIQQAYSEYYYIKTTYVNASGTSTTYYLQYTSTQSSSWGYLSLGSLSGTLSNSRWQIVAEDGGYRFVNQASGMSLKRNGNYAYLNTNPQEYSSEYYWRFAKVSDYQSNELTSFSIPANEYTTNLYGSIRFAISQTTPSSTGTNVAAFADFDDFRFRGFDSGSQFDSQNENIRPVFDVNKLGNMFVIKPYEVFRLSINMEHIPSGLTDTFTLSVNPIAGEYIIRSAYSGNNFYIKRLDAAYMCVYQGYDGSAAHGIRLVSAGSGYFYLKTDNNYYLTADSSDVVTANLYNTGVDNQLWKIVATSHNRVRIQPKSNANKALKLYPLTPYTTLRLGTYTSDSNYDDEWQMQIKDVTTFAVPGVDVLDGRQLSRALNREQSATSFGYANTFRYINADWCMTTMRESNFFVFGGHGLANSIIVDPYTNEQVTSQQLLQLDSNALNSTKLVLYLTCYCGQGGANGSNLVTTTAALGAQTVIGFTIKIDIEESLLWGQYFLEALLDNYSISYAMSIADVALGDDSNTTASEHRTVVGNISTNPYTS